MKEYIVIYENKYAVIPEDYTKEKLKEFPIEVMAQMAIETMKQDNSFDIEVFQKNKCANKDEGGFSWYTIGEVNNNTFLESGIIYELPDKNFFISIEDLKKNKNWNN